MVAVGRISPVKDHITLIDSANRLVNEMGCDVEFQIVGAAPTQEAHAYFNDFGARATAYGLEGRVLFVGSVPNREMPGYYREAAISVNMQVGGKAVLEP